MHAGQGGEGQAAGSTQPPRGAINVTTACMVQHGEHQARMQVRELPRALLMVPHALMTPCNPMQPHAPKPPSTYGQLHVCMLGDVGRDLIPPDDGHLEGQGHAVKCNQGNISTSRAASLLWPNWPELPQPHPGLFAGQFV